MAKARVKRIEGRTFLGIDADGNSTVMASGDGPGVGPMQMLLLGLGGCSMVDVIMILEKQRQPLVDIEIEIDGNRRTEGDFPRPWETIHMHFIVTGSELDAGKVARAIDLSVEKYCGAYATLAGIADISHDFELCPG